MKMFNRKAKQPQAPVFETDLVTEWATSFEAPAFNRDQIEVDKWFTAELEHSMEALTNLMTLADAEELIATCHQTATEHEVRAVQARQIAAQIAKRLSEPKEQLTPKEEN